MVVLMLRVVGGSTIPVANASRITILRGRVREAFCRLLNRWGVPGAIKPMDFQDAVTKQHISVQYGLFFMVLTIDGRDYYFDRITGRFDGTGLSACCL
jgi:hypothetical protein